MWPTESLRRSGTKDQNNSCRLESRRGVPERIFVLVAVLTPILAFTAVAYSQAGSHVLFGDVKVDDSKVGGTPSPMAFHIILFTTTGNVLDRQVVPNNGRYRFSNVRNGEYDVGIEVDGVEIGRVRVMVQSVYKTDFQQDLALELKPGFSRASKGSVVSAADFYERGSLTKGLFENADRALLSKNYDEALRLLKRVVEIDPKDFQAWTQLGTVYLGQKQFDEADSAYLKAIEVRPSFFLALLNLGRLRLMTKNYETAIVALTLAIEQRKDSADANFYLGEAYLQVKKGTLGAKHLSEALRLDPVGQADAHLRLATLYNAAGMKDKAALEYEAFLKKKPDYPERKKLEKYIADNKKP
jgi:Tfp pilus assembly protein PilF